MEKKKATDIVVDTITHHEWQDTSVKLCALRGTSFGNYRIDLKLRIAHYRAVQYVGYATDASLCEGHVHMFFSMYQPTLVCHLVDRVTLMHNIRIYLKSYPIKTPQILTIVNIPFCVLCVLHNMGWSLFGCFNMVFLISIGLHLSCL